MELIQRSCGVLNFFAIPSEGKSCSKIDRHTYKWDNAITGTSMAVRNASIKFPYLLYLS